jgi:hypothetical protein
MDTRYNLMTSLESFSENPHNIDVMDSTTIDWSKFKWDHGYIKHYINANELLRPYLLSYIYFGTVAWEYIILELNGIDDIEDVPVGSEIWIPKLEDLSAFLESSNA